MPVRDSLARVTGAVGRGVRSAGRRTDRGLRFIAGRATRVRAAFSGGETGMMRLFDLHAVSIAGDTLIAVGLAGTIFFTAPLGEARSGVALYLLVTMVPFSLLAPLIGPMMDQFRHGRRYALAATMLGRALLAWLIADQLDNIALYPAAFGVLVLSRAYGVARAAAVPRLLPRRLRLSQANARGSVYGTFAGAVVLPLGLAAFWFGPQWPLRVAAAIFLLGMVVALLLPDRADSDPPELPPRPFRLPGLWRAPNGERLLSGRLVLAALAGSAVHRALYGFLLVFLAFSIRTPDDLPTTIAGYELGDETALGLVSGALVTGTFLAVAAGSRIRIHRPIMIQAIGLTLVTTLALLATIFFALPWVTMMCVTAAISSGFAKLAIDSAIQERLPERLRATAFAHSETVLMLAFVAGGALGLIPMAGQLGLVIATALVAVAAVHSTVAAVRLRRERLAGRPHEAAASAPAQGAPADTPVDRGAE